MKRKIIIHPTDCGRYPTEKSDCSVRALAHMFDISYQESHAILKSLGRKDRHGFFFGRLVHHLKLQSHPELTHMTVARVISKIPKGRYIIKLTRHVFCVIDGVIFDFENAVSPNQHVKMVWSA